MSTLTYFDHFFAIAIFLVFPWYARMSFPRVLEAIRTYGEPARIATYKQVVFSWMGFGLYVLVMWALLDRNWSDLGFRLPTPAALGVGLAVSLVVIALVVLPLRSISHSPKRFGELKNLMGSMAVFMPISRKEERWFKGVSINAGVFEELVFRGYLIWYLQHFVGTWWAAGIATVLFGYGHIYQGLKQLPGILFISAVAVGLFIYTESLLVPVLFHFFVDALQGHYIAKIQRADADSTEHQDNVSEAT